MKKTVMLLSLVILLSACAGMDYQYQRNMAVNAAGYGLAGAAVGVGIAAVTHGNIGTGAVIGTVAGAALGAANTPPPPPPPAQGAPQPQPQNQPPAAYTPPSVVYVPPPVVMYAPPPVVYMPPIVYGGYYAPYFGYRGGISVYYYDGGHRHHSYYNHHGRGHRW